MVALAHIDAVSLSLVVDEGSSAALALAGVEVEVLVRLRAGDALVEVTVIRSSDWAILNRSVLGFDVVVEVIPVVGRHAGVDQVGRGLGSEEVVVDLHAGVGGGVEVELIGAAGTLLLCQVEEVVRGVALDAGYAIVKRISLRAGNVEGRFFGQGRRRGEENARRDLQVGCVGRKDWRFCLVCRRIRRSQIRRSRRVCFIV